MTEKMQQIILSDQILDVRAIEQWIQTPGAGGMVTFTGTVRNQTQGRPVAGLIFEAYEPMALREMTKIAEEARSRFEVLRVAIHHRTGALQIGEIPVLIGVSAAHRAAAFAACAFCIDTLKETVPIWKKELFEDGSVWVAAHP
jgi:molybdopterin synthase catalytic subunit